MSFVPVPKKSIPQPQIPKISKKWDFPTFWESGTEASTFWRSWTKGADFSLFCPGPSKSRRLSSRFPKAPKGGKIPLFPRFEESDPRHRLFQASAKSFKSGAWLSTSQPFRRTSPSEARAQASLLTYSLQDAPHFVPKAKKLDEIVPKNGRFWSFFGAFGGLGSALHASFAQFLVKNGQKWGFGDFYLPCMRRLATPENYLLNFRCFYHTSHKTPCLLAESCILMCQKLRTHWKNSSSKGGRKTRPSSPAGFACRTSAP